VPTLRELRARGLRTALVSDCTVELPAIVAGLPVAGLLDATVYSIELGLTKPDPRLFRRAAGLLGMAPLRCLYVGDGGGRELTGARAVGMTAVRLAEADLADHLVFNNEPPWSGTRVPHLADVLNLL
jgi:putative hydrolase of the HAD superfamily